MAFYTSGILAGLVSGNKTDITPEIYSAMTGSKEMKKEMLRVFQKANRRAQNIENAGLISPALQALKAERGTYADGYSKFSITGLNLNDEHDWALAKIEYNRALQYLNNPTSSARGARQYIKHVADTYTKGDFTKANILLEYATKPEITESGINAFEYRSILENFQSDVMEIETDLSNEEYAEMIEQTIEDGVKSLQEEYTRSLKSEVFLAEVDRIFKDVEIFPYNFPKENDNGD